VISMFGFSLLYNFSASCGEVQRKESKSLYGEAQRVGFEPTVALTLHGISSAASLAEITIIEIAKDGYITQGEARMRHTNASPLQLRQDERNGRFPQGDRLLPSGSAGAASLGRVPGMAEAESYDVTASSACRSLKKRDLSPLENLCLQ
jgi:hypothetical protein